MRVLSWNLYHGRDFPPDPALFTWRGRLLRKTERNETHAQVNRPLLDEFGDVLDGLEWDLALLQEAPPRWFRDAVCAHPFARHARQDLAQLVPAAAAPARRLEPGPARVLRRRLEPDARARSRDGCSSGAA